MARSNLVFMFGEDSLSLQDELSRWKKGFEAKHTDMNLEDLKGDQMTPDKLGHLIRTAPFLSQKRLIIIRDLLANKKSDQQKEFLPVIAEVPETSILVFVETKKPDKRLALTKYLNKEATLKAFEKPKGYELTNWIQQRAQKIELKLSSSMANRLLEVTGDNLWALHQELEKLKLYAKENSVTAEMIQELCSTNLNESIFTFTDQLAQGKKAAALKSLKQLQEQGVEAPYLFSMIARQFRLMLEMKSLLIQGMPSKAIASKMKLHPFVVQKTLPYCHSIDTKEFKEHLEALQDVDRRLKTGKIHLRTRDEDHYLLAVERIILK